MSDPKHPTNMSETDVAALRALDPAAFEDADTEGTEGDAGAEEDGSGTDGAAATGKDGTDAGDADEGGTEVTSGDDDKLAAAVAGDASAEGGENGGSDTRAPPKMVPRARLDEVIEQRNRNAAELQALREQIAQTKAPKDFDAEFEALLKRFDENEISIVEFERERRKLSNEETAHLARVHSLNTSEQTLHGAVKRDWEGEVAAFSALHPDFFSSEGNVELFQRAVNAAAVLHVNVTDAELLQRAGKLAFEQAGYVPQAARAPAPEQKQTHPAVIARQQQNAQRAADASSAPAQIRGGVGSRGGPERSVDVTNIKPGSFSKNLSKAEQERLLGEGAL